MPYVKLKYLNEISQINHPIKKYSVIIETDRDDSVGTIEWYVEKLIMLKCDDVYLVGNDNRRWKKIFSNAATNCLDRKINITIAYCIDCIPYRKRKILILRQAKNSNQKLKNINERLAREIEDFYFENGVKLSIEKIAVGHEVSFFCANVIIHSISMEDIAKIGETLLAKELGFFNIKVTYTFAAVIFEIPNCFL